VVISKPRTVSTVDDGRGRMRSCPLRSVVEGCQGDAVQCRPACTLSRPSSLRARCRRPVAPPASVWRSPQQCASAVLCWRETLPLTAAQNYSPVDYIHSLSHSVRLIGTVGLASERASNLQKSCFSNPKRFFSGGLRGTDLTCG